jgi:hypothetical protein
MEWHSILTKGGEQTSTAKSEKEKNKMSIRTSNTSYTRLAGIGTGTNPRNSLVFDDTPMDSIGVTLSQEAAKKAVSMELVVPIRRSRKGSRRTAKFMLSGRQARELYETLNRFYTERDNG